MYTMGFLEGVMNVILKHNVKWTPRDLAWFENLCSPYWFSLWELTRELENYLWPTMTWLFSVVVSPPHSLQHNSCHYLILIRLSLVRFSFLLISLPNFGTPFMVSNVTYVIVPLTLLWGQAQVTFKHRPCH